MNSAEGLSWVTLCRGALQKTLLSNAPVDGFVDTIMQGLSRAMETSRHHALFPHNRRSQKQGGG
jgi:hypothetical protein